ncbi:MAG: DNA mismatch repair endonuclease MutL [Flavobacteriaceae bacterium]|jgi:DNA mismatch repair protein MutL|nr:DNA mismatch repair endonuclease MutL [Flavobacteriaceae bacterium]
MADIIHLLPDHVANQIAAGEVVQRPASVVKELLENAIDAGATTIKLLVKNAGKTLIQVIDDGKGMSVTDARLSFERHATSKIRVADDLFNLHTKGFRGEALASIAAIAHVELKTKQASDELGTLLTVEGSVFTSQDVIATPNGTSIAVKNLFFNIPARRNFLKSDTVEFRHIIDEFHRVVLAHPAINFSLYHNGSDLFNLLKGNFRQRIVSAFGGKMNEKLVPVNETTEIITVTGFVGKPEYSKKSRGEQFFFVNNRFIKSPYLNHAISSAFEGLLQYGKHPCYFLNLEVDPQSIDINIHPTKTEIKFDDEQTIYAILRAAVKHSLGQFSIAPVLDFERDKNLDTPYGFQGTQTPTPKVEVDREFNPFSKSGTSASTFSKPATQAWEGLYVGLESKSNTDSFSQVKFESDEMTSSIFDDLTERKVQKTFQLHNKYIINTIKSGMLVIDQNRAHERILYEEFLRKTTVNEAVSQQLLFPLQLNFSKSEFTILTDLQQALETTGFVFSSFTIESVELTGLPVGVKESEVQSVFDQLIHDIEHEVPDVNFSLSDLLSKSLAKSLAIKNGKKLEIQEQEYIVNTLFSCKEPSVSPSNKTIFTTLKVEDLDKKFN